MSALPCINSKGMPVSQGSVQLMCNVVYCYRAAQERTQAVWTESNRLVVPNSNVKPAASVVEDVSDEEEIAELFADLHFQGGKTQVCYYATCDLRILGLLAQASTKTCACMHSKSAQRLYYCLSHCIPYFALTTSHMHPWIADRLAHDAYLESSTSCSAHVSIPAVHA